MKIVSQMEKSFNGKWKNKLRRFILEHSLRVRFNNILEHISYNSWQCFDLAGIFINFVKEIIIHNIKSLQQWMNLLRVKTFQVVSFNWSSTNFLLAFHRLISGFWKIFSLESCLKEKYFDQNYLNHIMTLLLRSFNLQSKQSLCVLRQISSTKIRYFSKESENDSRIARSEGRSDVGEAKPLGERVKETAKTTSYLGNVRLAFQRTLLNLLLQVSSFLVSV